MVIYLKNEMGEDTIKKFSEIRITPKVSLTRRLITFILDAGRFKIYYIKNDIIANTLFKLQFL